MNFKRKYSNDMKPIDKAIPRKGEGNLYPFLSKLTPLPLEGYEKVLQSFRQHI